MPAERWRSMNTSMRSVALGAVLLIVWPAGAQPRAGTPPPPDSAKSAHAVVAQCAGIGEGERVLITGGVRDLLLLENMVIEVRKCGAQPLLVLNTEALDRRLFADVPTKYDDQPRTFQLKLAELVDVQITVDHLEHLDLLAEIPAARQSAAARADQAVMDTLLKRGVRQVSVGNGLYPTAARAAQLRVSQEELARIFWNAVAADYTRVQAIGEKVKQRLAGGDEVKITAPNGTDLRVKIAKRPVFVSDGVISAEDRAQGGAACQVWLPAGEVYVSPVPGTAQGTFVADFHFAEGRTVEGLKMEYKDGKLISFSGQGALAELKQRYDAAPAGRDLFAFVDVGINPAIEIPAGSRMVTWMAAGSVSVGCGNDTWAGGENDCPYDLYAMLNGATVTVDDKPLVEKGKLVAEVVQ